MKKLITTDLGGQPFYYKDFEFAQEQIRELAKANFGHLQSGIVNIVNGADYTISTDGYTVDITSEGWAWYNGEYYYIPTQSATGATPNLLKWVVEETFDPRGLKTFSETTVGEKEVYQVSTLKLAYLPSAVAAPLFSQTRIATPVLKSDVILINSSPLSFIEADFKESDTISLDNVTSDVTISVSNLINGQIGYISVEKDTGNSIYFDSPVVDMTPSPDYVNFQLDRVIYSVYKKNNTIYAIALTKTLFGANYTELQEGNAYKYLTAATFRENPWIRIGVDESVIVINSAINQSTSFMYYRLTVEGDFEIWLKKVTFSTSTITNILLNLDNLDIIYATNAGCGSIYKSGLQAFKPATFDVTISSNRLLFSYADFTGVVSSDYMQASKILIRKETFTII